MALLLATLPSWKWELAQGSFLIIIADATLQDADRELEKLGHMTARGAGELARDANARKLVLNHIWPEYEKSTSLREAEHSFTKEIVLAQRGLELVL